MEKTCSKCKTPKLLVEFPKRKNGKYGCDHTCKECANLYRREKYANDEEYRERASRRGRRNRYNLTDIELDEILIKKECEVCGNEFSNDKDKHIDHNHNTGEVRGVLCSRCNTFLGYYELYPELINKFEKYIGKLISA